MSCKMYASGYNLYNNLVIIPFTSYIIENHSAVMRLFAGIIIHSYQLFMCFIKFINTYPETVSYT